LKIIYAKREDRQSLISSPFTTSGQETEWVYSYIPGAWWKHNFLGRETNSVIKRKPSRQTNRQTLTRSKCRRRCTSWTASRCESEFPSCQWKHTSPAVM